MKDVIETANKTQQKQEVGTKPTLNMPYLSSSKMTARTTSTRKWPLLQSFLQRGGREKGAQTKERRSEGGDGGPWGRRGGDRTEWDREMENLKLKKRRTQSQAGQQTQPCFGNGGTIQRR